MSEHKVTVDWRKETDSFDYKQYNREHDWKFDHDVTIRATAAPKFFGKPEFVDPEEAFTAALSSCHMLTFLALCAKEERVVESYVDDAVGYLEPKGKRLVMARAVLRPRVTFAEGHTPDAARLNALHEKAHHLCFLANSVTTEITVEDRSL